MREILTDLTSFNIRKHLTWPSFLKVHFSRRVLNMLINFGTLVFVVSLTIIPRARMGSELNSPTGKANGLLTKRP